MAMMKLEKVDDEEIWWKDLKRARIDEDTISKTARAETANTDVKAGANFGDSSDEQRSLCDAERCGRPMVSRYTQGLFCGHPDCPKSQNEVYYSHLGCSERTYLPKYLAKRAVKEDLPPAPFSYLPDAPVPLSKDQLMTLMQSEEERKSIWKGFLCSKCHALNQRVYWSFLERRKCGYTLDIKLPNLDFDDLVDKRFTNLKDHDEIPDVKGGKAFPGRRRITNDKCIAEIFEAPGSNNVALILPKHDEIYRSGGIRDIFKLLFDFAQADKLRLRRFTKDSGDKSGDLNYWFGLNIGHDYQNCMKMNSLSYADAPQEVVYVVEYMMDLIEGTLKTRPKYNETLLVAMWPDMGMSWHGDNEEFLVGDSVASMSFGSRATMGFELNDKYSKDQVRGIDPIDVAVVPGCLEEEKRQQIRERYHEGQLTRDEANKEMSAVVKGLKVSRGVRSDLSIPLP